MPRRCTWFGGLLLGLGLFLIAQRADALIDNPVPMGELLKFTPNVFLVKVEKLNPGDEKATMVLKVEENLKKKDAAPPFKDMKVVLEGTKQSKDKKELPQLLKRLREGQPLIVFVDQNNDKVYKQRALVYTNGTWFFLLVTDPEKEPWQFQNLEPVQHRSFSGPTDALQKVIVDWVKTGKAPAVDKNAKPGIGPELKDDKKSGMRRGSGPVFAVIPTVAIGGPLAILAVLFPSLFGSPKDIFRRYSALLTVISINSLAYMLHLGLHTYFAQEIQGSWWASQPALWVFMAVVTLVGTYWAWRRYCTAVKAGQGDGLVPRRGEWLIFQILSYAGLLVAAYALGTGKFFDTREPWLEMVAMWTTIWAGTLGIQYLRSTARRNPGTRPNIPLEGVMLGALALACILMVTAFFSQGSAATVTGPPPDTTPRDDQPPTQAKLEWVFKSEDPGSLDSTPLVVGDKVYAAVAHRAGLRNYGRLYCLDRATSKVLWTFGEKEVMKPVFSTPCIADGRLYIGEGYHQNDNCRLFCINPDTGALIWDFQTGSHTESSPCVVGDRVYFGAGDDGVYCLDVKDGKEHWHYQGLHVDTNPAVVDGRLYGGSGYGKFVMFCLDAKTGKRIWEVPSKLPVFGSPTVLGKQVFFGSGTGNLVQRDTNNPAGALSCLNAETGAEMWIYRDVKDAVHTKPAVDRRNVYFGSTDGHMYCVNRRDGTLRWKFNTGSPVAAAPALVTCPTCGDSNSIYAIGSEGHVYCLDPDDGKQFWMFDVAAQSKMKPQLLSSPRVEIRRDGKDEYRRIYFGAGLDNLDIWTPALYCLEDCYRWPVANGKW
ncbi:MAG: PQQ-binding-like beta-propeller repeat protein [Gemmataceae bacterium]|nr:PQQ-binding-like beta-propeller repeat protein [Gemmataceae bacterium]